MLLHNQPNSMKQSKIRNSVDTRDIYRQLKKGNRINRSLSESDFALIVKSLNGLLGEELKEYGVVDLPVNMGKIVVLGFDRKIIKNNAGKIAPNNTPNWKETLKLWNEDNESRENKTLVYHNDERLFKIKFKGEGVHFKNVKSLCFKARRQLREEIRKLIQEKKLIGFVK